MLELFIVGCGGFVGAILRYGVSLSLLRLTRTGFPLATFLVNVVGCFLLGGLMALAEGRPSLGGRARLFVMIGLLGSFTTFSTFGYETIALIKSERLGTALLSVSGNLFLGLVAVLAGHALGEWVGD